MVKQFVNCDLICEVAFKHFTRYLKLNTEYYYTHINCEWQWNYLEADLNKSYRIALTRWHCSWWQIFLQLDIGYWSVHVDCFYFLYQSLRFYAKVITGKTQTNEARDLQLINFFSSYQQIKEDEVQNFVKVCICIWWIRVIQSRV